MKYTILWIDDQYDEQEGMFDLAHANDIELIPHKTSKSGREDLEANFWKYDGVILDAKVFDETEDEVAGIEGMYRAIHRLKELTSKRVLPFFVFTGQQDLLDSTTFAQSLPGIKIYKKGIDTNQLMTVVKSAADALPETQIRHKYSDVFSIFTSGYLPPSLEHQVLELIKSELPTDKVVIKSMLVNIRSIHESCMLRLAEIGILPTPPPARFIDKVRHLSGNKKKENDYKAASKEYQNESIENLQKWLYFTCGSYIHNLDDEKYKGYMISKYAMESLRSGLLEVLLWFKKINEENSK